MKNCKPFAALILAAMLFATNALAVIPIQPFWTNVSEVRPTLSFSGTTANCSAFVQGFSGTTKIAATVTLARKNGNSWTTVKTWTQTANSTVLTWSGTQSITTGNTYRLTITANVTRNGTTETVSNWIERNC